MNHLFREDQKVGHLECDKQNVLLCCKTTLSLGLFCVCVMSTLCHIVCCFSLVPCCLVTGIEHAPWSWHRSTTFPSFPRLPASTLTTAGDYISHGSLEELRSVPISFVPGLKRQPSQAHLCGRRTREEARQLACCLWEQAAKHSVRDLILPPAKRKPNAVAW